MPTPHPAKAWSADRNLPAPSMTSTPAAVGTAPGLEDHHVDRPEVKAAQAVPRCFFCEVTCTVLSSATADLPNLRRKAAAIQFDCNRWALGFAEPHCDPLGRRVLGIDQRDEFWHGKVHEPIIEGCFGRLGRVAVSPIGAIQRPGQFDGRPAFGLPQPNAAEKCPVRFALDNPEAVSAKHPEARI